MDERIERVAGEQGVDITSLVEAHALSEQRLTQISTALEEALTPSMEGADIVVFGSLARGESTGNSDCDYLVLVDVLDDPRMPAGALVQMNQVITELGMGSPGAEGVFGDFAISAELTSRIGLDIDTNKLTTRRLLLLVESVSVYRPEVRQRTIDHMLRRYALDYDPEYREPGDRVRVPRFLLNDLSRYWRTMTVDFGAKRWRVLRAGSDLRLAKLVTTRKVLFAGTLATLLLAEANVEPGADPAEALRIYLAREFERPPLARLLAGYEQLSDVGRAACGQIVDAYAQFIDVLNSNPRDVLEGTSDGPEAIAVKRQFDDIKGVINRNLVTIFFDEKLFADLTREYAVF